MNGSAVKRAEQRVRTSTREFERAIGHLEDKVDQSARRAERMIERVKRPVVRTWRFMNRARATGSRYAHRSMDLSNRAFRRTQETSRRMVSGVRRNPRPFMIGAATAACGLLLAMFLRRRRSEMPASGRHIEVDVRRRVA